MKRSIKFITSLTLCILLLFGTVACSLDEVSTTSSSSNGTTTNGTTSNDTATSETTSNDAASNGTATNDTAASDADLKMAMIGTYTGVDGSVLTFMSDGTADYYFKSDDKGVIQGQAWSVSGGRVTWTYNGQIDVYADIKGGDVSSLTFKSDGGGWKTEQYTKVSNEAAHWTVDQCNAFLEGGASTETAGTTDTGASLSKEEAINQALSGFTTKGDEVEQYIQYRPSAYPQYINTRSYVLPFIVLKDGNYILGLQYSYYGSDYIGWNKLVFAVDDNRYEKKVDILDVKTNIDDSFKYVEYFTTSPKESDIELLREIANSTKTIIRFKGDTAQYDLTVTEEDKQAINEVLDAYDIIKQYQ